MEVIFIHLYYNTLKLKSQVEGQKEPPNIGPLDMCWFGQGLFSKIEV